jgi:tetratricopeptide (TPR) repeat protein
VTPAAGVPVPVEAAPTPASQSFAPPPPAFQLTKRHIVIGGSVLAALIIIIAVVANRGGDAKQTAAVPGDAARQLDDPNITIEKGDPVGDVLSRANELVANGRREAAIDLLSGARKTFPDDARLAYLAGKLYFAKLWYTDGLKQFRDAVRLDPAYKADAELIKTVLKGFNTTPRYDSALASFLREHVGDAAKPFLEETAESHPNPSIRARAASELRRY